MAADDFALYGAIKALSERLRTYDEEGWADALDEALASGTLPGEVIGATRQQMERLNKSGVAGPLGLQSQVDAILRHFDSLPGQWGRWGKLRR